MDQLRLILLIVGVLLIAGIFVWELYKKRVADRRREELVAHLDADERGPLTGESLLGDIGQADPFDVVERAHGRRSVDRESGSDDGSGACVPLEPLEGYDIDEDFPGEPPEEITETPVPRAVEVFTSTAVEPLSGDDGGLERLSGFAARRDSPEQLDLAGLDLAAPARGADVASERRAAAAVRSRDGERRSTAAQSTDELHIVMTVMARSGERFSGDALRDALEKADLYHGDMKIFHRHERPKDLTSPTLFSVANVLSPGNFEPERMDTLTSPGIAMFMRLPGPEHPADAFQLMLDAAKTVAEDLDGTLCDESRSTLTPQSINHLRERIADFGRRQMLKA
jgi:cell division protein ZipA